MNMYMVFSNCSKVLFGFAVAILCSRINMANCNNHHVNIDIDEVGTFAMLFILLFIGSVATKLGLTSIFLEVFALLLGKVFLTF